jgi:hypothetical protein
MRPALRSSYLCSLLLTASLQAQSSLPPGTWPVAEAPAELHDAISRGDLIVVSLHDALRRELTSALAQGGPVFAMKSCHVDVTGVTRRISRGHGMAAGRTSDRLRNPANAPATWAAPPVKANAGRPARDVEGFVVDLGDAVGLLRPIAHQPMCNACHGPVPRMDPAVAAELKRRYPADRAINFREGEIRGWFWVEVPKNLR